MSQVQGVVWIMQVDILTVDGPNPTRLRVGALTPMRVELSSKLIADTLATRDMIRPRTVVEVPLVEGEFCQMPFNEVTTMEW